MKNTNKIIRLLIIGVCSTFGLFYAWRCARLQRMVYIHISMHKYFVREYCCVCFRICFSRQKQRNV